MPYRHSGKPRISIVPSYTAEALPESIFKTMTHGASAETITIS